MAKTSKSKSGGKRKWGRNVTKCARYRLAQVREKHKVKRVLQSSGIVAAKKYAAANGVLNYLEKLAVR